MSNILSDLWLYGRLVSMQIRAQMQYKANIALDIGTNLCLAVLEFAVLLIWFSNFPTLLGWRVGEVVLLYSLVVMSFGISDLFGAGIDAFAETIRRGEFDRLLLRPVSVLIQVIGSDFRLRRLGRIIQGMLAFIIALRLLPNLHWTLIDFIVLPIGILSGSLVFIALLLLGATLCFWTVETTELTNLVTDGGREMLTYPLPIYHEILQRIFLFVIPLAFGSYVPACYLLGRPLPFGLPSAIVFAAPLIALAFALVTGAIWTFGVHNYQSTGS